MNLLCFKLEKQSSYFFKFNLVLLLILLPKILLNMQGMFWYHIIASLIDMLF